MITYLITAVAEQSSIIPLLYHIYIYIIPLAVVHYITSLLLMPPPRHTSHRQQQHSCHLRHHHFHRVHHRVHHRTKIKKRRAWSAFMRKFIQRVKFKIFTYIFQALLITMKVDCRLRERRRQRELLLAYHSMEPSKVTSCRFDIDSFSISVDNCASRTIANNIANFENLRSLTPADSDNILGINGMVKVEKLGTFVFDIEDDDGHIHTIRINNSAYAPDMRGCLLSPQHWAQEAKDNDPQPRGTRMEQSDTHCILIWGQKSIPFNPSTNTAIFRTAPSTNSYRAFVADCSTLHGYSAITNEHVDAVHVIPPDDDPSQPDDDYIADENILPSTNTIMENEGATNDDDTIVTSNYSPKIVSPNASRIGPLTFDPTPPPSEDDQPDVAASDATAELMRWHYRLGHLPFVKLQQLAKNGEIPRRLAKVTPPKCAGCIFGAMTKKKWRDNTQDTHHIFVATKPGECVSVDQMISTQVGFVAQLKGRLTTQRYRAATIFVDHYSRVRYVHLMQSLTSIETIAAKRAFERFADQHGVIIQHYHADNGRFADNMFMSSCEQQRQRLTFCGVNAHFQNGITERAIRDLTESARKQLLHARQRWPAAIHLALWPYALRNACYLHNNLPTMDDGTSRIEKFSGIRVGIPMRDVHAFGCPVFALQNALASGNTIPLEREMVTRLESTLDRAQRMQGTSTWYSA